MLGLLFIVPLSDILENQLLAVLSLIVVIMALFIATFVKSAPVFLTASLFIGLGSVVAQILVPYATYLSAEEQRGRVVGNVMSGLLLGIMFARPIASFIASLWGWQAVFAMSAVLITLLTILLATILPKRTPVATVSYGKLIASLGSLLKHTPVLRRRAIYQAFLFGSFSMFWTVIPLHLADHFHLTQQGIAWVALAGVGGAVAAPIAGRLADKGWTRKLTGFAMLLAAFSFAIAYLVPGSSLGGVILLSAAAILLDMAVSGNLVLSQRAIYSLGNEARGRLNGLFMAIFFIGGAIGSSLGGWIYSAGGFHTIALVGISLLLLVWVYYLTERKATR